MKKLLPVILLLLGTGAGVGAGVYLRPEPPEPEILAGGEGEDATPAALAETSHTPDAGHAGDDDAPEREYARMSNQFIVPVVEGDAVTSMILLSLSVEVKAGNQEAVFRREPKLRASFLEVMFDHANIGGFDGAFTNVRNLELLRASLKEVATRDVGDFVTDVLITEIARQDY